MNNDAPLRVKPTCPKCDRPIVYNGNYFCSWRYCNWALDDAGRNEGLGEEYAILLAEGKIKREKV